MNDELIIGGAYMEEIKVKLLSFNTIIVRVFR